MPTFVALLHRAALRPIVARRLQLQRVTTVANITAITTIFVRAIHSTTVRHFDAPRTRTLPSNDAPSSEVAAPSQKPKRKVTPDSGELPPDHPQARWLNWMLHYPTTPTEAVIVYQAMRDSGLVSEDGQSVILQKLWKLRQDKELATSLPGVDDEVQVVVEDMAWDRDSMATIFRTTKSMQPKDWEARGVDFDLAVDVAVRLGVTGVMSTASVAIETLMRWPQWWHVYRQMRKSGVGAQEGGKHKDKEWDQELGYAAAKQHKNEVDALLSTQKKELLRVQRNKWSRAAVPRDTKLSNGMSKLIEERDFDRAAKEVETQWRAHRLADKVVGKKARKRLKQPLREAKHTAFLAAVNKQSEKTLAVQKELQDAKRAATRWIDFAMIKAKNNAETRDEKKRDSRIAKYVGPEPMQGWNSRPREGGGQVWWPKSRLRDRPRIKAWYANVIKHVFPQKDT